MAFNAALWNGSSPLVRSSPIADDEQCINPSVQFLRSPGLPEYPHRSNQNVDAGLLSAPELSIKKF